MQLRVPIRVLAGLSGVAFATSCGFGGSDPAIDPIRETSEALGIPLESRQVSTNGIRLHVVEAGPTEGRPVVLLHGMPEFWWGWRHQLAGLAKAGFRVIVPDQRGYNESEKPTGVAPYRMAELAEDIRGLVVALGFTSVSLAGHDWGGIVAFQVAIRHPELVQRLVVFNAPHPLALEEAQVVPARTSERTISWYRVMFQLPWVPELVVRAGDWALFEKLLRDGSRSDTFSERDLAVYKQAWARPGAAASMINWYRAYASFRFPHQLDSLGDGIVRVPARIVWGAPDAYMESRLADLSLKYCADGAMIRIPNSGHWVLHEEPEATARLLVEFFGSR